MRDGETIHGRGAAENPPNRFERSWHEREPGPDDDPEPEPGPTTQFLTDASRTIIATNDSPDVGFDASVNPYRGCEHGCIYCLRAADARVPRLLRGARLRDEDPRQGRRARAAPRGAGEEELAAAAAGDERRDRPLSAGRAAAQLTRRCLEVLAEFRNPVAMITKNHLVTRDADLLGELARFDAAAVFLSITTLDAALARVMEPRTSTPRARLAAIAELAEAGVPRAVSWSRR